MRWPSPTRVFPTLYFLKGALALHALRTQIGDEQFFAGFKKLFAVGTSEPVTLDYCRQCFESVHGGIAGGLLPALVQRARLAQSMTP